MQDRSKNQDDAVVDLGKASIETRGIGAAARDGADEQFPSLGLTED